MPIITSLQNPRVKDAIHLRNARHRRRQGRIIIDGVRELARAASAGIKLIEVYVCQSLLAGEKVTSLLKTLEKCGGEILEVSEAVFQKLAFGSRAEGILAVGEMPQKTLDDLSLPSPLTPLPKGEGTRNPILPKGEGTFDVTSQRKPLIAVLEGVEKPGNIGAVLRSADAAGVSALILADAPNRSL